MAPVPEADGTGAAARLRRLLEDAERGEARAQRLLALRYLRGRGVAVDPVRARHWLERAAGSGHPLAQRSLGELLEAGLGVAADGSAALALYRAAAGGGDPIARRHLERLLPREGNGPAADGTPARESCCAILFADVAGSTQLYEILGDVAARAAVARCIAIMSELTARHGGTVIKTIGDEVMSTFAAADDAGAAAVEIQQRISGELVIPDRPMSVRVGFHFGPVLLEQEDVFGDAVNLAARIASQAKARQILTTRPTVERLTPRWQAATRQIDRVSVRGKRQPVDVFELVWEAGDATCLGTPLAAAAPRTAPAGALLLTGPDLRVEMSESHPSITLGRAGQNEVVAAADVVSRLHARLDCRQGRFVFTDQSTNGSYLVDAEGRQEFVHRDSIVLRGAGLIGLGEVPRDGSPTSFRFEITAPKS